MKNKKWEKPKLIVLKRAKAEENVLDGCKISGGTKPGGTGCGGLTPCSAAGASS